MKAAGTTSTADRLRDNQHMKDALTVILKRLAIEVKSFEPLWIRLCKRAVKLQHRYISIFIAISYASVSIVRISESRLSKLSESSNLSVLRNLLQIVKGIKQ